MSVDKEELVQRAMLAEIVERHDDMMSAMKAVTETGIELSNKERNLLSIGYKNAVDARRSSWRAILSIEHKTEVSKHEQQLAKEYRIKVENELQEICNDVLRLLDQYLIPKATNAEATIFYLRMRGDYCRYLVEITTGDAKYEAFDNSQRAYKNAFEMSKKTLSAAHPVSLGVALNYAVFYYEILNSPDDAWRLGKRAFNEALAVLDKLNDEWYDDSRLIMQRLRENIQFWASITQRETDESKESENNF